jgi:quercetin dioxygenase-like cupin family protein
MTYGPFVVTPKDRDRPLSVAGEQVTVLASGARTGSYEIFLQRGPAGSGPPPHNHDWDESFYVTSGRLEFGLAERTMTGTPGTLVHVPAGTTHWFRFTEDGEMISMTSREGASRFFADVDREVPPGNPQGIVAVATRHGLKVEVGET